MTIQQKRHINQLIQKMAQDQGRPVSLVRKEMREAIDAAWQTEDLAARERQQQLFPEGKPSLELFVLRLAGMLPPGAAAAAEEAKFASLRN